MGYTKATILKRCEEALKDISQFYNQAFVNYTGKTIDSENKEYYTEVIAEFLLRNLDSFNNIKKISRGSYRIEGHSDPTATTTNRVEERIAKELYFLSKNGLTLAGIGKIIDYQVPLKAHQDDKAGKIDLLAYNKDTNELRILELKRKNASKKETMLRCALEAYTYLRTVDQEQLKRDYSDFGCNSETKVLACPFVFKDGPQHNEMKEGRPKLLELMERLDNMKPYYLELSFRVED